MTGFFFPKLGLLFICAIAAPVGTLDNHAPYLLPPGIVQRIKHVTRVGAYLFIQAHVARGEIGFQVKIRVHFQLCLFPTAFLRRRLSAFLERS